MTAISLFPEVALVGGGWLGFGLSNRYDSNVYLIASGGDAVLIDAGAGLEPQRLLSNVQDAAVDLGSVSRILLTHAHADHAAGARTLAELFDAEVWASEAAAELLESGDEAGIGLPSARAEGLYPDEVKLFSTRVSRRLDDEEELSVGALSIQAVRTDGHSKGHLSYVVRTGGRQLAFCGDVVFARGRVVLLDPPDGDAEMLARSLRTLEALKPDALLPGHGELVLEAGVEHVRAALLRFEQDLLPDPFLA